MPPARIVSPPREEIAKLRTPLTPGEIQVLEVLDAKLDRAWEIYVQPHLNGCRPDLILLNPNVGIGILEIKDWDLATVNLRWQKDRRGADTLVGTHDGQDFRQRDPVEQILQYKREIFDIYCPRLDAQSGLAAISAGVIFSRAPDSDVQRLFAGRLPSDYEYVAGRQSLAEGDVARLFPPSRHHSSRVMAPEHAADLRSWLIEPDHSSEQRDPVPLDATQRLLANRRTPTGYRRIRGPAGSGKSAILAARAALLADDRNDVLVVTFNITLLHYLRDLSVRVRRGRFNDVTWIGFHALCKRLAIELDMEQAYRQIWRDHFDDGRDAFGAVPTALLGALAEATVPEPTRYDAILVDEGQDFQPEWWQLLRHLCRPGGEMVLVADATQDLYGTSRLWTDRAMVGAGFTGPWNELRASYRLPNALLDLAASFANRFLPADGRLIPRSPKGESNTEPCHLRWVQVAPDKAVDTCVAELLKLIATDSTGSRSMTDLTLLVDRIEQGSGVVHELEAKGIKTAATFASSSDGRKRQPREDRRKKLAFWKGQPRVKVTTIHSFKGWEARTVVLNITRARSAHDLAAIYAGLTRVKRHVGGSFLTVVCSDAHQADFGRSWPEFRYPTEERGASA